ncbi:MAG: histidine kinase [Hymenobacter sp.]
MRWLWACGPAAAWLRAQRHLLQAQRERELAQAEALRTAQAVLAGQEEERARVARDLHDGLGGTLATVKLYLGSVRSRAALPPEPTQLFTQAITHLDEAIAEPAPHGPPLAARSRAGLRPGPRPARPLRDRAANRRAARAAPDPRPRQPAPTPRHRGSPVSDGAGAADQCPAPRPGPAGAGTAHAPRPRAATDGGGRRPGLRPHRNWRGRGPAQRAHPRRLPRRCPGGAVGPRPGHFRQPRPAASPGR